MAVAPFWSDNDIRKEGAVRYASYHTSEAATNPEGKQWLDQVNEFIQNFQSEGEDEFQGSWVLTVHWENVHPSPHGEDDHRGISEEELAMVNTRRMLGIETASRAEHAKSHFLLKGQRLKSCHTFLPGGIQIEDLTQASCHA